MKDDLPKNWIETELGNILVSRKGKKPNSLLDNQAYKSVPYILIEQLEGKPNKFYTTDENLVKVSKEEVLMVWDGSIGKFGSGIEGALGSTLVAMKPLSKIPTNFLKYVIYYKQNYIKQTSTGVGLQHINKNFFKECKINLPPLPEQERIVAKLDALFAQHEAMKRALERIPQLLKCFRQQVLNYAVNGKLTEEWRKGKKLENWEKKRIDEMSFSRLGKMLDKTKNIGKEHEYLGNIDVQWNKINLHNLKKIKIEEREFEKFQLKKGDVLVCEGGEAGRAAIWEEESSKIIYQKALHRIRVHKDYHPKFLLFNLEVDTKSGKISELYTGTTIKHLTGQSLAKYKINYPPLVEQQEIVSRVESLFTKADTIERRYKTLKEKIDSLPQAILHKAFKGELVPQLPTDGDAKDLLEEILKLKKQVKKK